MLNIYIQVPVILVLRKEHNWGGGQGEERPTPFFQIYFLNLHRSN